MKQIVISVPEALAMLNRAGLSAEFNPDYKGILIDLGRGLARQIRVYRIDPSKPRVWDTLPPAKNGIIRECVDVNSVLKVIETLCDVHVWTDADEPTPMVERDFGYPVAESAERPIHTNEQTAP